MSIDVDHWYFSKTTVVKLLAGGLFLTLINFAIIIAGVKWLSLSLAVVSTGLIILMNASIHPYNWRLGTLAVFRLICAAALLGGAFGFYRLALSLDKFSMAPMVHIFGMVVVSMGLLGGLLMDRWVKRKTAARLGNSD